ncbi:MAG: lipoyl(octanoyl) transferase LipB [Acidobacteria bacterium]|nr:lipoyl(octanoyl) transferase LipB [Acidobacteriota bacterium]
MTFPSEIATSHLGIVEYRAALEMQREYHTAIAQNLRANTLLLLEHPSVYTAGKRTLPHERPFDGTPVIDVDRGGKITWHGPGQLVGYPIVRLAKPTELVGFVRELESALIQVCAEFGVATQRIAGRSGVWVVDERGERKIAAIGIRVAQGVTMHGFALNVNPDLAAFNRIIPCGISDASVTSLERETGRTLTCSEIANIVEAHMIDALKKVSK